jgi:NCAIR mutase (PurE)-related protein
MGQRHEQGHVKTLAGRSQKGDLPVDQALNTLKDLPFADLGYAKVDHHRAIRSGHPETIYSPGKTIEQIVGIAKRLLEKNNNIMATRAEPPVYEALQHLCENVEYHEVPESSSSTENLWNEQRQPFWSCALGHRTYPLPRRLA